MTKLLGLVTVMLLACDGGADPAPPVDADAPDAAVFDGAPLEDAAPCGGAFEACCPGNDVRCDPENICNSSGVCEPMCFPYCTDAG